MGMAFFWSLFGNISGGYGEKYPGKMMEAMAYYEILYLTSLVWVKSVLTTSL